MQSLRELTLKMKERPETKCGMSIELTMIGSWREGSSGTRSVYCSLVPLPLHLDCSLLTLSPVRSSNAKALPRPLLHSDRGPGTACLRVATYWSFGERINIKWITNLFLLVLLIIRYIHMWEQMTGINESVFFSQDHVRLKTLNKNQSSYHTQH